MRALEEVFGPIQQNPQTWNPWIAIRHGIFSNDTPFQPLASFLAARFPKATIDNQKYDWHDSVVFNGARLANTILSDQSLAERPLILIGHSIVRTSAPFGVDCSAVCCFGPHWLWSQG
jgi:hypothetical protein